MKRKLLLALLMCFFVGGTEAIMPSQADAKHHHKNDWYCRPNNGLHKGWYKNYRNRDNRAYNNAYFHGSRFNQMLYPTRSNYWPLNSRYW